MKEFIGWLLFLTTLALQGASEDYKEYEYKENPEMVDPNEDWEKAHDIALDLENATVNANETVISTKDLANATVNVNETVISTKDLANATVNVNETVISTKDSANATVNVNETRITTKDFDYRRPVWNIGHMVNSIGEINEFLKLGANSIEFDVAFTSGGQVQYTYHGLPCDCFRSCLRYENFKTYIEHLRNLTTPGSEIYSDKLMLIFMDLKLSSLTRPAIYTAGLDVGQHLTEYYWVNGTSNARCYIMASMPSIDHIPFIRGLKKALQVANLSHYEDKIGYDFSGNENFNVIYDGLHNESIKDHVWIGDGITNCLPRGANRLKWILDRRDAPAPTYPDKVYWWTVDKWSTMKRILSLGVDGLITNYPQTMISVLEDPEIKKIARLAAFDDHPFQKHIPKPNSEGASPAKFMLEVPEEVLFNS